MAKIVAKPPTKGKPTRETYTVRFLPGATPVSQHAEISRGKQVVLHLVRYRERPTVPWSIMTDLGYSAFGAVFGELSHVQSEIHAILDFAKTVKFPEGAPASPQARKK